ncbi:LytR/AlgR family response regulator transcription factor [Psychroflexus sp. MES1-P1E]|uniref:LytR/AlgR family response regulator transcription factor n=1 Tax=Psychroflexus sp. MES1-P1E TaxID=2058320 RepID=UPI000C7E25CE|nr:response regulator [Psychroflexus sp. MES1-P1E]PKG42870.1 DNA-binding response regulator [Psychroflexus sp. MES1-P1E]
MKISCLVIDDEPLAIQVIKSHLNKIPGIEIISTFQNPVEALDMIKSTKIDLIFLDIEMPLLSGIELLKTLQHPPKVIFTTAYRNYATESYELDVVDYLLKPISFTRFLKAINKYKNLVNVNIVESTVKDEESNNHLYVNSNKKFIKLNFNDILYVESIKDYVKVVLHDKSVITKDSISNFEYKLPHEFLRIHRSFIVNTIKVTAFTKVDVEIGARELPIGASYKDVVIGFLKEG